MRPALILGVIAAALAGAGCTRVNPEYCDAETPCRNGGSCDPLLNRCGPPGDAGADAPHVGDGGDAGADAGGDAATECAQSSDCTDPDRPICEGTSCQPCSEDNQCLSRAAATPACVSGQCLECDTYLHCAETAGRPLCGADHTCHACTRDAECRQGPEPDVGVCVAGDCPGADDVLWVDAAASCPGNGSPATPFCDVGEALGAAATGARKTIVVKPGPYPYVALKSNSLDGVVIVGLPGNDVLLEGDGSHPAIDIDLSGTVTLRRLKLTGGGVGVTTPVLKCYTATCMAGELEITAGGLGVSASAAHLTLRRSWIHDNLAGGVLASSSSFRIENNFISGNGSLTSALGGVTFNSSFDTMRFVNNTVYANRIASGPAGLKCDRADIVTVNNILWDNRNQSPGGIAEVNEAVCAITYSVIDVTAIATAAGAHNTEGDPKFIEAVAPPFNLHLNDGSSALGGADPVAAPSDDFDGEPRPAGGPTDIGADQR